MVLTLPNTILYAPLPSIKLSNSSFSKLHAIPRTNRKAFCNGVKAITGEGRDNLDYLQKATQQPKKQTSQPSPFGLLDKFPAARTVQQMMDTMEGLMDDSMVYSRVWPSQHREGNGYNRRRPPWAIKETEKNYKMRFDVPGMTKNDVKVWIEENMLVFKAEKAPMKQKEDQLVNGHEKSTVDEEWLTDNYGKCSYRIALPENIEFDKIKADVRDGVLYITIPKASIRSKIIPINVE